MTPRTAWLGVALVLVAVAALGYRSGLGGDASIGPAPETEVASPIPAIAAKQDSTADVGRDVDARTGAAPLALPDELWNLDGEAFLSALPELERRARGGDMAALRVIYRRSTDCVGYLPRTDDEIRAHAEENYARSVDIERDARARNPDWKLPPGIPTAAEQREHSLRAGSDRRTVCTTLTPADLERRFDWARLALEQHDHRMIIDLGGAGHLQVDTPELVRNAERLIDLQEIERVELDRLVGMGDMDAIARAAISASNQYMPSLTPYDPVRSWALAKVWLLANPGSDKWGMQARMDRLEKEALTSAHMEQARAQADELYARCCASARSVGN